IISVTNYPVKLRLAVGKDCGQLLDKQSQSLIPLWDLQTKRQTIHMESKMLEKKSQLQQETTDRLIEKDLSDESYAKNLRQKRFYKPQETILDFEKNPFIVKENKDEHRKCNEDITKESLENDEDEVEVAIMSNISCDIDHEHIITYNTSSEPEFTSNIWMPALLILSQLNLFEVKAVLVLQVCEKSVKENVYRLKRLWDVNVTGLLGI
ncbi:935_t:CDS:2, partial [Funneliformis geosporum]